MAKTKHILPGATLGMLGGGQLGRMFTLQAHAMGYKVIVLDPDKKSPAGAIANEHIAAQYDDETALIKVAKLCDAITTEFENIPVATLSFLEQKTIVHPSSAVLAKTQNRLTEKQFVESLNIKVTPYVGMNTDADIDAIKNSFTFPAILKTARLGYDGKGQVVCRDINDVKAAFKSLGSVECVLEKRIDLLCEVSAVLARSEGGEISHFPIAENVHVGGILHSSTVPSSIESTKTKQVMDIASAIAQGLNYVGTMAVEFFITKSGDILVNEIAPRPHNSGHFTLDACQCSQFEQQIRMLCNLPHGNTKLLSPVVMVNLLGDLWVDVDRRFDWEDALNKPSHSLHLYGKQTARLGRKMGHFNVLADNADAAMADAMDTCNVLSGAKACNSYSAEYGDYEGAIKDYDKAIMR